jgi:MoaA/NifB/PqqE/SkfB family radical SAM enzyme
MLDLETRRHRSRGRACKTGEDVISVAGDGTIRRCHFVDEVLGNLYHSDLEDLLRPRPCPRATCECWIGYAHLSELNARGAYSAGRFLARMPGA